MAETRVVNLEVNDNTKSLKLQLREAQQEVQKLADKYGATSKEAVQAAKRAADLKDRIGDAKALTDAFNPDAKFKALSGSLTGVAGGFSAVTGAMGLFGAESKEVQKLMLKVQSAMALSQGLQALGESRDAFRQLGAVAKNALQGIKSGIAATGIGLLVVALGTVVAYWDDIKEAVSGVSDEQRQLNEKTKANYEIQQKKLENLGSQDNILKLQGKTERQILQIKIKQTDETIKALEISIAQNEATLKSQVEAAERNQNNLKLIFRIGLELSTAGLRLLAAPIDAVLATANAASEALGFGKITTFSLNNEITKLNKSASEWASRQFFDPKSTKADGQKTIEEQKATLKKLQNDRAGMLLQIQELDRKAAEANSKNNKKSAEDAAKQAAEARKKLIETLKQQYEDEIKLNEEIENQKIAMMQDGIEKEKALRQDQFNDYRNNFLRERIKDEEESLNKLFETGKINQAKYQEQLADLRTNAELKLTEKEKEILSNARQLLASDLLKIDEKYEAEKIKLQQDALKTAQDLERKRKQEFDAEIEALDEQNFQNRLKASMTEAEYEKELVRQKYFYLENAAKDNAEQLATITEAKQNEINEINKKYALEDILNEKAKLEQKQALQQQGMDIAVQGVQLLKDTFGKSKAVQKGAVIVESAVAIAKMIQANNLANIGALATPQAIATSGAAAAPVIAMNNVQTGIGIAANIAATAKALKAIGSGGSVDAPNTTAAGGGGAGGGGGSMAPNFNVVGNNNINQLAQLQQQPIKAYVVGAEVTTQQSLDRNRLKTGQL